MSFIIKVGMQKERSKGYTKGGNHQPSPKARTALIRLDSKDTKQYNYDDYRVHFTHPLSEARFKPKAPPFGLASDYYITTP